MPVMRSSQLLAPLAVVTALHARFCSIFYVRYLFLLQYDISDRDEAYTCASKHVRGLCNA